jgi:hypothetical protein
MTHVDFEPERLVNPVDTIEHIAALNDWVFDRSGDNEISISVAGSWTDYHISFTWMDEIEALHLACAFDLKVPEGRRREIVELLVRINEQLWIGRRAPRATRDRFDQGVERTEVEPLDEGPDHAGAVLGRQEIVQRRRHQLDLGPLRSPQPRCAATPSLGRRLLRQRREQPRVTRLVHPAILARITPCRD